jgi:hypothetical protein
MKNWWYILWPFGVLWHFVGIWYDYFPFRYVVPTKKNVANMWQKTCGKNVAKNMWQPCGKHVAKNVWQKCGNHVRNPNVFARKKLK